MSDSGGQKAKKIAAIGADIAFMVASGGAGYGILIPAFGGSNPPAPAIFFEVLEHYPAGSNRHSRGSGNPAQPMRRLPWTPACAGVTGRWFNSTDQASEAATGSAHV